jgi:hypothetical protein
MNFLQNRSIVLELSEIKIINYYKIEKIFAYYRIL